MFAWDTWNVVFVKTVLLYSLFIFYVVLDDCLKQPCLNLRIMHERSACCTVDFCICWTNKWTLEKYTVFVACLFYLSNINITSTSLSHPLTASHTELHAAYQANRDWAQSRCCCEIASQWIIKEPSSTKWGYCTRVPWQIKKNILRVEWLVKILTDDSFTSYF